MTPVGLLYTVLTWAVAAGVATILSWHMANWFGPDQRAFSLALAGLLGVVSGLLPILIGYLCGWLR